VLRPTRQYYDQFAAWYERERHHGYHALVDRLETELACRYAVGGRVLEAGCGTGLILSRVAEVASQAYGLDLSSGMLARAAARGLGLAQGSVTALPFKHDHFDLVYSFKVLAHVELIEHAVAELVRVTRPGGHVLLEFYNSYSLRYLVKRLRPARKVSEELRDDAVFTRFDTLSSLRRYLPGELEVLGIRGVRVLTPLPHALALPVLGNALAALESWAADAPLLRSLGGFLIVIGRKRG
jgi:ubiquinone/menaquinone biosynthesis C-methylase UbiE